MYVSSTSVTIQSEAQPEGLPLPPSFAVRPFLDMKYGEWVCKICRLK